VRQLREAIRLVPAGHDAVPYRRELHRLVALLN
jgi:hypothetical protein